MTLEKERQEALGPIEAELPVTKHHAVRWALTPRLGGRPSLVLTTLDPDAFNTE